MPDDNPSRARLSAVESAMLAEFATAVRRRFGERIQAITLFGSRARGEGHEESDLDVLVLLRDMTRDERRAVIDDAFDVEMRHGLVLSPLVADPARFRVDLPLGRAIEREGLGL